MQDYTELESLRHFVLEESWVLGVVASPGLVELTVDFTFAGSHPDLLPPRAGDANYTRVGVVRFEGVSSLVWTGQGVPPATDSTGEKDWGAIDSLKCDGSQFWLEGDWGAMHVACGAVSVELSGPV
jgi:hypothetical protein